MSSQKICDIHINCLEIRGRNFTNGFKYLGPSRLGFEQQHLHARRTLYQLRNCDVILMLMGVAFS